MSDWTKVGIAVALVPFTTLLAGWAISTLWGWFMVPLGLMEIGILHGVGLQLLYSAVRARSVDVTDDAAFIRLIFVAFTLPPTLIFVGWIVASLGGLA